MTDDLGFWLDARGPFVNLLAGDPGGYFVPIRSPALVDVARRWERACEAAARLDADRHCGLLHYVREAFSKELCRLGVVEAAGTRYHSHKPI